LDGRVRAERGTAAELAAERYLKGRGLRPLARDVRLKNGQVDLMMLDGKTVVVVEVKARRGHAYGLPQEAVDRRKMERLRRLAQIFHALNPELGPDLRIDVVAVDLDASGRPRRCHHIAGVAPV
jgi:putative endonuclease